MVRFMAWLIFSIALSARVLADCPTPRLSEMFLNNFAVGGKGWTLHAPHYYEDERLGVSIKIESSHTTIDYFVYDLGLAEITNRDVQNQFENSIREMYQFYSTFEKSAVLSDPFLINPYEPSWKKLVDRGAFIIASKPEVNELSVVSLGFDGRCFQKLRYTKNLYGTGKEILHYFDNPVSHPETLNVLMSYRVAVKVLFKTLQRQQYFD